MRAILLKLGAFTLICVLVIIAFPSLRHQYNQRIAFPPLREHLSKQLRDPESTQYRGEFLTSLGVLCGELNSKNTSGGYVGFKRFIVAGPNEVYLQDDGRDLGHRTTEEIRRLLDATRELLAANAAQPGVSVPDLANKRVFNDQWHRRCESTD